MEEIRLSSEASRLTGPVTINKHPLQHRNQLTTEPFTAVSMEAIKA